MNYKEIIQNVLKNGVPKKATRLDANGVAIPVENETIGTFCEIFRHDMSKGFPLTTLRKMPWQSIRVELEGFIKGITDKDWYRKNGCGFWNEWANPKSARKLFDESEEVKANKDLEYNDHNRKSAQLLCNDLGPIYGYQWRSFGKQYGEVSMEDYLEGGACPATGEYQQVYHNVNGVEEGFDQLKSIVDKLKTNPYDRRMVCSAWNPNQEHLQALPPCHYAFTVVVYGNKLNLCWKQRSCDLMLGVGANIASYALLLELLAFEAGLVPGELVGILEDCHIYENHMEAAKELASRDEKELPLLSIISHKKENQFSIFDWEWKDAVLTNYNPHDKVEVGSVTV